MQQFTCSSLKLITTAPGNTHQAPRPFSWKWYEELRDKYGEYDFCYDLRSYCADIQWQGKIFRLRVLGDNFVILNDPTVAEILVCFLRIYTR